MAPVVVGARKYVRKFVVEMYQRPRNHRIEKGYAISLVFSVCSWFVLVDPNKTRTYREQKGFFREKLEQKKNI